MESNLFIGKYDIVNLAQKFGTPLYIYDGDKIESNYQKIFQSIPYQNKQMHYAIMCNNRPEILKILFNCGAYLQVNSLKEYKYAKSFGFSNEKISVATTNISPKDMLEFIKARAILNLDSIEEVERYGQIVGEFRSNKVNRKIGIRVFVHVEETSINVTNQPYQAKARVGIHSSDFEKIKKIAEKYQLEIIGVHGYMASNMLTLEPFLKLNHYLIECAENFPKLEYINFGAGFGVATKPDEEEFNWEKYGKNLKEIMDEISKHYGREISLKIEPGRSLVGDAGILITEITNIKNMENWVEVGVDCGFGVFARPYIYKWNEGGYHPVIVINKMDKEPTNLYTICGNSVLQGDYLAEDRKLPSLEIGDLIGIQKTGAYGSSMASLFPGMRRAGEIIIYKDKLRVITKTEKVY